MRTLELSKTCKVWVSIILSVIFLRVAANSQELLKHSTLPGVGDAAPNFMLKDFDGKSFILSQMRGKKTVMLWFTNLCSGCLMKIHGMERLKNIYREKGIEIVAISQLGNDRKTVEGVIRK